MDVREKLVELLDEMFNGECCVDKTEAADFLIAHGVTAQEWISVKDKLPPYNLDVLVYRPNMAMKILVDNYAGYYGEDDAEWHEGWAKYGKDIHNNPLITHWMPLPEPPTKEAYQWMLWKKL